jgi:hypothetical protein
MVLRNHDDVKRHRVDKCCNKFKKPMGSPGDPKRDMIPRCQQIQQRFLKKSASSIMGADSEGEAGLDLSEDLSETLVLVADDDDGVVEGGILGTADGMLDMEQAAAEELAAGIGGRTQSRVPKPTNIVDSDAGIRIMALEELSMNPITSSTAGSHSWISWA